MSDNQTQQITEPFYYDDGDVIHACAIMDDGVRLVWTKCDMDVPDDQGFTVDGGEPAITCPECLKAVAQGQHHEQARPGNTKPLPLTARRSS
jgi:hypothetical protein